MVPQVKGRATKTEYPGSFPRKTGGKTSPLHLRLQEGFEDVFPYSTGCESHSTQTHPA